MPLAELAALKNSLLVLMIMISGLLIMVGFRKTGFGLFGTAILMAVRGPFTMAVMQSFVSTLPPEVYPYRYVIIATIFGFFAVFFILKLKFVRDVIKALVANILADFIYAVAKMPFRIFGWCFARLFRRQRP